MFDVFGSVKSLLKLDSVCIDNNVFRLHYKGTVVILVAFSLLVTSRQYIGDPIDCIVDASIGGDIMDTYCWIHSTYTLPDKLDGEIGKQICFIARNTFSSFRNMESVCMHRNFGSVQHRDECCFLRRKPRVSCYFVMRITFHHDRRHGTGT